MTVDGVKILLAQSPKCEFVMLIDRMFQSIIRATKIRMFQCVFHLLQMLGATG